MLPLTLKAPWFLEEITLFHISKAWEVRLDVRQVTLASNFECRVAGVKKGGRLRFRALEHQGPLVGCLGVNGCPSRNPIEEALPANKRVGCTTHIR